MIVHGTTLAFLVSGGFLFGAFCGYDLHKEDGGTPAVLPTIAGIVIFTTSLITLLSRSMG